MSKGLLNLYCDNELKELAKSKGINLSAFFNDTLRLELELKDSKKYKTEEQKIKLLRNKVALLTDELTKKNLEIKALKKKTVEKPVEKIISYPSTPVDPGKRIDHDRLAKSKKALKERMKKWQK